MKFKLSVLEEWLKKTKSRSSKLRTLIARGFPRLDALCEFVQREMIDEAVIITVGK